jgi:hypothetical protein
MEPPPSIESQSLSVTSEEARLLSIHQTLKDERNALIEAKQAVQRQLDSIIPLSSSRKRQLKSRRDELRNQISDKNEEITNNLYRLDAEVSRNDVDTYYYGSD